MRCTLRTTFTVAVTLTAIIVAPALAQSFPTSSGSGFIVGANGEVLTNAHVVNGCSAVRARLPGDADQSATVIALDRKNDLALLKLARHPAARATFRTGSAIRPGDSVVALGYPLAGILASQPNVSVGAISALAGIGDDIRYLQMSAPIQPGNSGGPLLDSSGNVVGIVSLGLDSVALLRDTGQVPENVNFAIKDDIAKRFLDKNNVGYDTTPVGRTLSAADVSEHAMAFTVFVECTRAHHKLLR